MAYKFNPITGDLDYYETGTGTGTSDHGALTGLGDDDHTQYHNNTRGDARYYTKTQSDTALSGKSDTGHTHTGVYAPALGADDNYVTDAEKTALHSHSNKTALDNVSGVNTGDQDLSGYSLTSHNHTGTYEPANANIQSHIADTNNPHGVTKAQLNLENVDNTSDADKAISTATQSALDGKADVTHTHDNYAVDSFGITVDGTLTTGSKGYRYIEQDCLITGWDVRSNVSGNIVFDVKRGGTSIAGSQKPTLSGASSNQDMLLSTWTSALSAGDIIEFVIDSVSTLTRATLTILVTKI